MKQRKKTEFIDEIEVKSLIGHHCLVSFEWIDLFRTLTHTYRRKKQQKINKILWFNLRRRLRFKRRIRFFRHLARIVDQSKMRDLKIKTDLYHVAKSKRRRLNNNTYVAKCIYWSSRKNFSLVLIISLVVMFLPLH